MKISTVFFLAPGRSLPLTMTSPATRAPPVSFTEPLVVVSAPPTRVPSSEMPPLTVEMPSATVPDRTRPIR